jgi:site-specific recombinase XerD
MRKTHTLQHDIRFRVPEALRQFTVHLEAANLSRQTIASYTGAVQLAADFFTEMGLPDDVTVISAEHLRLFVSDLKGRRSQLTGTTLTSATVVNRFKGLRAFWKWLMKEGEITDNPMLLLEWPKVRSAPVATVSIEEMNAMVATCGRDFVGRRDAALMWFMIDMGWRAAEIVKVTVEMMVTSPDQLTVQAKGDKTVTGRVSPPVLEMLNRYLRMRRSPRPELWLARTGKPMNRNSLWEVLAYRSERAGIKHVYPHMLRHSHASWWLEAGGNLMDLKENMGHSSIKVTERYLEYRAGERAREARRQYAPGNRLR